MENHQTLQQAWKRRGPVQEMIIAIEEWKQTTICESYEVSNFGRVRRIETLKILKPWKHKSGHLYVKLATPTGKKSQQIHRLVALAFLNPPLEGEEVRHKDGLPEHNYASNLCWGTRKQNILDLLRHSDRFPKSCTTFAIAETIRRLFTGKHGEKRKLAARFRLSEDVIGRILSGKTYSERQA